MQATAVTNLCVDPHCLPDFPVLSCSKTVADQKHPRKAHSTSSNAQCANIAVPKSPAVPPILRGGSHMLCPPSKCYSPLHQTSKPAGKGTSYLVGGDAKHGGCSTQFPSRTPAHVVLIGCLPAACYEQLAHAMSPVHFGPRAKRAHVKCTKPYAKNRLP